MVRFRLRSTLREENRHSGSSIRTAARGNYDDLPCCATLDLPHCGFMLNLPLESDSLVYGSCVAIAMRSYHRPVLLKIVFRVNISRCFKGTTCTLFSARGHRSEFRLCFNCNIPSTCAERGFESCFWVSPCGTVLVGSEVLARLPCP